MIFVILISLWQKSLFAPVRCCAFEHVWELSGCGCTT